MAIKESTHWYEIDGTPRYTVIGANGNERNTTLRDARKMNLLPSVTTIIGAAAKPGLENWKIDQALMAALTLPKEKGESLDEFMQRAKRDAKEQAIQAAALGTDIHAQIEDGFTSGDASRSIPYLAVRALLDGSFGARKWVAEDSFGGCGFAGKVDLYSTDGIVVDFKTKDGPLGDPKKMVYDEHGMQLSAYAYGLKLHNPTRVSIFIDRKDHSSAVMHIWDEESHIRHLGMFMSLHEYWMLSKNYRPEV